MITAPPWVFEALRITFIATFAYVALLGIYAFTMLGMAMLEGRFRRRQDHVEDYGSTLASRYSIPVSVIVPAYNEDGMVVPAIRSLLAQSYSEFEVVVVDDGSTDDTLSTIADAFDLEPRQVVAPGLVDAKPVHMAYRSRREPRLTVVSKINGGKADAVNAGINFARYRYLCVIDADTMFAPDALLKAMTLVARDPGRIVGAGSLFGVSLEPEQALASTRTTPTTNGHLLGDFQHIEMMRAFVDYRAAWSRMNSMLCVSGAFGLWRKDVVVELGGFSPEFSCEDIEMTFRIHDHMRREKTPYRIIALPNLVGQTEGPRSVRSLISQRARWQRVTLETVWHYRRMLFNPRFGAVGFVGMPYYVLFECLAPLFHLVSILALLAAIVFGLLGWPAYLAFIGLMAFGTAIPTTVAVSLHDRAFRDYGMRDLVRMLVLGPLDLVLYRPILVYAGLRGTVEFFMKDKRWNKFERNPRTAAPAVTYS